MTYDDVIFAYVIFLFGCILALGYVVIEYTNYHFKEADVKSKVNTLDDKLNMWWKKEIENFNSVEILILYDEKREL